MSNDKCKVKDNIALQSIKNGEVVICSSGYTFPWNYHHIVDGMVVNYENYECNVDNIITVKNKGYVPLAKTLNYLNNETSLNFEYSYGRIKCEGNVVYDIKNKTCVMTTDHKYIALTPKKRGWVNPIEKMAPDVFIDKIEKGEFL